MAAEKLLTIIAPDGTITAQTTIADLPLLQKLVGGYIELVVGWTTYEGRPAHVYANEDGKHLELPVNVTATDLWYEAIPHFRAYYSRAQIDNLRGTIVIEQTLPTVNEVTK